MLHRERVNSVQANSRILSNARDGQFVKVTSHWPCILSNFFMVSNGFENSNTHLDMEYTGLNCGIPLVYTQVCIRDSRRSVSWRP